MKLITLLAVFLTATISYGQQPGYYVTKSGQKAEGFFAKAPSVNDSEIKFKTSKDADYSKISIDNIAEYGSPDKFKLKRFDVDADFSVDKNTKLSASEEPIFQKKSLLLEVLVEGDASLYVYKDNNFTIYFYDVKSKNVPVTQLIYKNYSKGEGSATNAKFRQQLYENVNCNNVQISEFVKKAYTQSDLEKIFIRYNECKQSPYTVYKGALGSIETNFTVFAGYSRNSFDISILGANATDDQSSFGVGAEFELVLPSKKVSAFIRAEYIDMSAEPVVTRYATSFYTFDYRFALDGSLIAVNLGPRYYVLNRDKNKVFVDASVSLAVPVNGTLDIYERVNSSSTENKALSLNLATGFGYNFGAGYMFNDKFGAEVRYTTSQNFMEQFDSLDAKLSRLSLNLRYSIL